MLACAVALVLLMDASSSIAEAEWRQQRDGTAEALVDPAVLSVLRRQGVVAVTALAFAESTAELVPWRLLTGEADVQGFAEALRAAPRPLWGGTFIGPAMADAAAALNAAPRAAEQEVVDIASDGGSDVAPAEAARTMLEMRGVRVNALGVGTLPGDDPARWLRAHAVTSGGFAIAAAGWGEFARAMRRKLSMELAAR